MKYLKISFTDQQLDKLSGLFLDLGKGLFVSIYALKFIFPSDAFTLSGLLLSGIISVYISLWILERKKRKDGNKSN